MDQKVTTGVVGPGRMGLSRLAMVNAHPRVAPVARDGAGVMVHAPMVTAMPEKGPHVLCETPFRPDRADSRRLTKAAAGKRQAMRHPT